MGEAETRPTAKMLVLVGAAVAVAVAVAIAVWLGVTGDEDSPDAGSEPTSPAATASPTGTPTGSVTSSPSPTPTPAATGSTTSPVRIKPIRADFGEEADLGNGVTLEIVDIEAVQGKGGRPGEVGGPSLRFTFEVENDTGEALNLDLAVVNVFYGSDDRPANQLTRPGGIPLPQSLPDGETATGRYIYNVPVDQRDQVKVEFGYTVEAPKVIYTGSAP